MNNEKKRMVFKELEYGVNFEDGLIYLTYDIDTDALYHLTSRLDQLKNYYNGEHKDITLMVSSFGGDVYSMLGIVDYIRALDTKVNTHCVGMAMSAAAVILACGTGKRTMTKNSTVMIHEGSALESGKVSDVITGTDNLKKLLTQTNKILGEVTNKTASFWKKLSKQDTYLTAEQSLEYGLIDEIVEDKSWK